MKKAEYDKIRGFLTTAKEIMGDELFEILDLKRRQQVYDAFKESGIDYDADGDSDGGCVFSKDEDFKIMFEGYHWDFDYLYDCPDNLYFSDGIDRTYYIDGAIMMLDEIKSQISPLALLNTSIIGHDATAKVMTALLGVDVPVNRQMFSQQVGQQALVFKLNGRLPEGKVLTVDEIEAIGFEFKILERWG